jgi:hypothetical protein
MMLPCGIILLLSILVWIGWSAYDDPQSHSHSWDEPME